MSRTKEGESRMVKDVIERTVREKRGLAALTLIVVAILAWLVETSTAQAPRRGNSAAAITGAFADSCRDFAARSSKDISHVEIHYISGLVIKDESITTHDYG